MTPRRIMVVGQPGAGKSTLAAVLAAHFDLPHLCTDVVKFRPGWIARPRAEWLARMRDEEAKSDWVIEGGLPATWDTRVDRAELVLWVERPLGLRLRRILSRLWRHQGRVRPELGPGYERRLRPATLRQLWSVWRTRRSGRDRIVAMVEAARAAGTPVVHLVEDGATRVWLADHGIAPPPEWG